MSMAICKLFTVGITNRIHFHSSINESSLIIHLYIDQTIFGIIFTKSCQKLSLFVDENYMIHCAITFQEKKHIINIMSKMTRINMFFRIFINIFG